MKFTNRIIGSLVALTMAGVGAVPAWSTDTSKSKGADKVEGETSQQKSQQGLGLKGSGSSNVLLGGPEIIFGKITGFAGNEFMIEGDRGQSVRLRVTKDTNMACGDGTGAKLSSSREGANERSDLPTASGSKEQLKKRELNPEEERAALNDPNRTQAQNRQGAPSKDPSTMKDVVGSTDAEANKDVARGSGFIVGGSSGCQFKAGDMVRIEASDQGTATTIQELTASERSQFTGDHDDLPKP